MGNEIEMSAQSEQAPCHWQGQDGILRAQTWWCGDREKPTRVGQSGFCMVCGTGLGPCGTEQARCDAVTSEAVQGTQIWANIRELVEDGPLDLVRWIATPGIGHIGQADLNGKVSACEQTRIIYAALSQSALAPAETTCRDCGYMGGCSYEGETHTPTQGCGGPYHREAAALAATGAGPSDGDTALMDALEEAARYGSHYYQSIVNWLDYERDSPPAWLKIETLRDLARALLAQAGGASDE